MQEVVAFIEIALGSLAGWIEVHDGIVVCGLGYNILIFGEQSGSQSRSHEETQQ